jgi:acyl carrier protein
VNESQARRLISDQLGVPLASAVETAALHELGADPLDVVALVLSLERTFGVRISDAQAESCRTVGDLLEAVRTGRPLAAAAAISSPIRA